MSTRAATLGVVAATALTACGAAAGSPNPVARAAVATQGRTTEKLTVLATVTSPTDSLSLDGSGTFDLRTRQGEVLFRMTATSAPQTMKPMHSSYDAITSGNSLWLATDLGHGKSWLRFDRAWGLKQAGVDLASVTGETPADVLAALRTSSSVTAIGAERLDGVETTHYRARLAAKAATNALLGRYCSSFSPADVWVDGDGLVRKVALACTAQRGTSSADVALKLTMSFTGFGDPVAVMIPPRAMVLDANRYGGN